MAGTTRPTANRVLSRLRDDGLVELGRGRITIVDRTGPSGESVNVVRAPDGDHFCPASEAARAGVTGTCPVWSSGAYRYGRAMAVPVLDVLAGSPM